VAARFDQTPYDQTPYYKGLVQEAEEKTRRERPPTGSIPLRSARSKSRMHSGLTVGH